MACKGDSLVMFYIFMFVLLLADKLGKYAMLATLVKYVIFVACEGLFGC